MKKCSYNWPQRAATCLASLVLFFAVGQINLAAAQQQEQQRIVMTLQVDPLSDQEPACVALQLGTLLLSQGADVTLFPTLDGVGIGNANVLAALHKAPSEKADCLSGEGLTPLPSIVDGFLKAGGTMVVCPLCWTSRYGTLEENSIDQLIQGETSDDMRVRLGDPLSIGDLFMNADKVIDF